MRILKLIACVKKHQNNHNRNEMKKLMLLILSAFFVINLISQDVTTVTATSDSVAQNLDLKAVASVFGESNDLEDFEKRLNDPDSHISNLDLNHDGEVDYLRVVEDSENNTHVVTIQAVMGKDKYQDVATIDVEKDEKDNTTVQVVGDVNMYGPNYIIEPVYVHPPVIITWFWGPLYHPWVSPFHWGYYPHFYHPWPPVPPPRYHNNVQVNINIHNTYNHVNVRRSNNSYNIYNAHARHDFYNNNPSVNARNIAPRTESDRTSRETKIHDNNRESTGRKVDDDWKPRSESRTQTVSRENSNAGRRSEASKLNTRRSTNNLSTHKAPTQLKQRSSRTGSKTTQRRGRR